MAKVSTVHNYSKDPDRMMGKVLGPKYRAYRKRWGAAKKLEVSGKYPIHIDFELRFGCTMKCPQCILQIKTQEFDRSHPYHAGNRAKQIEFSKFKEIIDEGVRHGLCSITLNVNNEPLLTPDIARYIRYARKAGVIDVIMLTNASLLTKKKAAEIIDSGLTKIYFSLDAINKETYRMVRRGGDFDSVMSNINYFLSLKKKKQFMPVTRVSFVKSKVNEKEAGKFMKYWKPKVDFVSTQSFINPAYGYSNYEELQGRYYIKNKDLKSSGAFVQPYQRLTIYNDGSAHPCCQWYGVMLDVGNVHSQSVYSIWNSAKMKKLRKDINSRDPEKVPDACRICRQTAFGQ